MATYSDFVRDDSGYQRPVEGAMLYLLKEDGRLALADVNPVRSDFSGFFEFTGVPDDVYTLDTRYAGNTLVKGSVIVGVPSQFIGPPAGADDEGIWNPSDEVIDREGIWSA